MEEVAAADAGDDFQKIARSVLESPKSAAKKAVEHLEAATIQVRSFPPTSRTHPCPSM